ncbi:MAG: ester cyclase [Saprospirales bacterium]|nr:ester cyclase [Saprospirales bacterium]
MVRHQFEGTHTGAAFQGVPATQRRVTIPATVIYEYKDGKATNLWLNADFLGLLVQLGAVPAPGARQKGGDSRRHLGLQLSGRPGRL